MLDKTNMLFRQWRFLSIVITVLMTFFGALTFNHQVNRIKAEALSAFVSRAKLVQQFLIINVAQVEVMRNRFVETFAEAQASPRSPPAMEKIGGLWTHNTSRGVHSGSVAETIDADLLRQMRAADGMSAQIDATLKLNLEVAWLYYLSQRSYIFIAPPSPDGPVLFDSSLYLRTYWRRAEPAADPERRIIVAGPYQDVGGKGEIVTIAAPVYDGARFLGVIALDLATITLRALLDTGAALGESALISQKNGMMASQFLVDGAYANPVLSPLLTEWDEKDGALWLSFEVFQNGMWIVHRLRKAELYQAAAAESADVWVMLLMLAALCASGYRLANLIHQVGRMSYHDALTELPNRRHLKDRLNAAVALAEREGGKVCLLFIDLDKFKPVNDRYGHETGDWLLKSVAERITGCLRRSDLAARIGGDEFVVLLPRVDMVEAAATVAEKIRCELVRPFEPAGLAALNISSSIGVALYPDHAANAAELLRFGDEAMYAAKNAGRNNVTVFKTTAA